MKKQMFMVWTLVAVAAVAIAGPGVGVVAKSHAAARFTR